MQRLMKLCALQLPFRNNKHTIQVDEPGLGAISGCKIVIKVMVRALCLTCASVTLGAWLSLAGTVRCAADRSGSVAHFMPASARADAELRHARPVQAA